MKKRTLTSTAVLLSLTLLLTACGSKGPSIDVTLNDFSFTPDSFTVPAGVPVSVHATNDGAATHDFIIMKKGVTVTPPFGDKDKANVYWQLIGIAPGSTVTGTFTAPTEPGTYEIVCGVPGHLDKGMKATLTVQ